MVKDTSITDRKDDHIKINLDKNVKSSLSSGLGAYRFIHQALPEIDLGKIDLSQILFGKTLKVPILVSSMTGGTDKAAELNRILATAAQEVGLAMGVGSQRAALEHPQVAKTFQIRPYAPNVLLFANLGAVQLNYGYGVDDCRKAVEMIDADGLILHLNPLQEALQPEGNVDFSGLASKIALIKHKLDVPLIIKEVGWGISLQTADLLFSAGVDAIDVAGAGGTSWSQVEMHRNKDPFRAQTAGVFVDWGVPTVDSLLNVRNISKEITLVASGGLHTGVDIAKCLALGANLGGLASPFLRAANESLEMTVNVMKMIIDQLRISMFACGAKRLEDLTPDKLTHSTE